jgi:hypothetical protein
MKVGLPGPNRPHGCLADALRQVDPGQLHNLLSSSSVPAMPLSNGHSMSKIVNRLDALLFVLKSCKGSICREPWKSLHPAGDVWTLTDALASEYDGFYKSMPRVEYNFCSNGYLVEAEGPMWESYEDLFYRNGLSWDAWT